MQIHVMCPYCGRFNECTLDGDDLEHAAGDLAHAGTKEIFTCDNTTCKKDFVVYYEVTVKPHVHKIE